MRTVSTDVYINAGPTRPFRAPGHPECAWALEQMMDALAHELDMDPVQLRLKNLPTVSQARGNLPVQPPPACGNAWWRGAASFGWEYSPHGTAGGQSPTTRGRSGGV